MSSGQLVNCAQLYKGFIFTFEAMKITVKLQLLYREAEL